MLEFIVLGQIPGTNIFLSLGSFFLGAAFVMGSVVAHMTYRHYAHREQPIDTSVTL
jgi:hypothetical protein